MSQKQELAAGATLEVPSRWVLRDGTASRVECLAELRHLGEHFQKGVKAVGGLYLRITDHVRYYQLTPEEVRATLEPCGFEASRISELMRVASAPENVYREYSARLVGFRVALRKTRLYYLVVRNSARYRQRQLRRMGVRMVRKLKELRLAEWRFEFDGIEILAQDVLNITNIVRIYLYVRLKGPLAWLVLSV